jgi:hypothetical protein
VSDGVSVKSGVGALPLVQPNDDVTVVYEAYNPALAREVAQTSHDGGAHFDAPVTIGDFEGAEVSGMRTGAGLPAAAVDPVTTSASRCPRTRRTPSGAPPRGRATVEHSTRPRGARRSDADGDAAPQW